MLFKPKEINGIEQTKQNETEKPRKETLREEYKRKAQWRIDAHQLAQEDSKKYNYNEVVQYIMAKFEQKQGSIAKPIEIGIDEAVAVQSLVDDVTALKVPNADMHNQEGSQKTASGNKPEDERLVDALDTLRKDLGLGLTLEDHRAWQSEKIAIAAANEAKEVEVRMFRLNLDSETYPKIYGVKQEIVRIKQQNSVNGKYETKDEITKRVIGNLSREDKYQFDEEQIRALRPDEEGFHDTDQLAEINRRLQCDVVHAFLENTGKRDLIDLRNGLRSAAHNARNHNQDDTIFLEAADMCNHALLLYKKYDLTDRELRGISYTSSRRDEIGTMDATILSFEFELVLNKIKDLGRKNNQYMDIINRILATKTNQ